MDFIQGRWQKKGKRLETLNTVIPRLVVYAIRLFVELSPANTTTYGPQILLASMGLDHDTRKFRLTK